MALELTAVADVQDAVAGLQAVGREARGMADDVASAARDASGRLNGVAESADGVGSSSSQAAGGIGDVAGALEATGVIGAGTATAMNTVAAGIQGVTGAADLVNLALGSQKVQMVATRAAAIASTVATRAMTIAQRALNLAMRANPIGVVITLILLLVAGIVLAYKRSATFRAIVQAAMAGVRTAIGWVVDKVGALVGWFRDRLGPAAVLVKDKLISAFQTARDKVSDAFKTLKDKAVGAINAIKAPIDRIIDLVQSLIDKIKNISFPDIDVPLLRTVGSGGGRAAGLGGGAVQVVNVTVTGALDADATARQISTLLERRARRLGVSW